MRSGYIMFWIPKFGNKSIRKPFIRENSLTTKGPNTRITQTDYQQFQWKDDELAMKRNKRCSIYFALLCTAFMGGSMIAQETQRFPTSLSLATTIDYALQYQPSLRAAEANVQSSSASLTLARAAYFPALSVNGTATRTDGAFVFNPSFPPRIQSYNNYTSALNVQQTVYDFGKTDGRVSGAHELLQASTIDYQSSRAIVIANAAIAYFAVLQAQRVVDVNKETLAQTEAHLKQARAYYAVGTKPQIDVTTAQVNVANANVNLISANNQLRIAKLQLENAMGAHSTIPYMLSDSLGVPAFSVPLDSIRTIALASRQDLLSARARVLSSQSFVSSASGQRMPTVSLSGTWNWSGFEFPLQSRWNAGVTLSVPVFQGFGIEAQVDQAQANLESSQATLAMATENALLDVEQNYLSLKEALDRIDATAKLVEQARENLKIAEGRYSFGVGSAIEITDAQVTLSSAELRNIQALYDYNSSIFKLKRAMGILGY
jgi:outer membrane protein